MKKWDSLWVKRWIVLALEKSQEMLTKTCQKLQDKCLGLENRSRRQNLRLVGENGNMSSFLPKEVLSVTNFDSPVVIDRAHRGQDETRDPLLNGETLNTGSRLDEGPAYVQRVHIFHISWHSVYSSITVDGIRHTFNSPQGAQYFYNQKITKGNWTWCMHTGHKMLQTKGTI